MNTLPDTRTFSGAKLVVLENGRIRVYPLDQRQKWLLGRSSKGNEPDIPFQSKIVSRQHGWLMGMDEEWYYVDNPRNLNGTWLNGSCIERPLSGIRKPVTLRDGDVLRVDSGETALEGDIAVMLYTTREVRGNWAVYPLTGAQTVTIGRDPDCDLIRPELAVSGKHAAITCLNGRFYLSDCGSRAGTILNGRAIDCPVALREKDHFSICGGNFFFLRDRLLYER